jgi:hypothetical protein
MLSASEIHFATDESRTERDSLRGSTFHRVHSVAQKDNGFGSHVRHLRGLVLDRFVQLFLLGS